MDRRNFIKKCLNGVIAPAISDFFMNTKVPDFKGIIQYGSYITSEDIADSARFATVQAAPLDGTVFFANANNGDQMRDLAWRSEKAPKYEDFSGAISDVLYRHSLGFGTCEQNFIHLSNYANTTPPDWFGTEMDQIITNTILMGRVAAEMGVGLWYDFEAYGASIWQYNIQPSRASYTFAQYKTQVKEVARTIASAWRPYVKRTGFRLMSAVSMNAYASTVGSGEAAEYGLFGAWLEGLYNGLGAGDGNYYGEIGFFGQVYNPRIERQDKSLIITDELSYSCQDSGCIQNTADRVDGSQGALWVPDTGYYQVIDEYGCALWIDYGTFDNNVPASNWFTPALFKTVLGAAIDRGSWVWIYNQQAKFYFGSADSAPDLNAEYITAIRDCRREKGLNVW